MTRFVPKQPDPFIKRAGDQELAKFGHLNALLGLINTSGVLSIVAGTNITVDNTDPANPVISATGGGSQTPWTSNINGAAFDLNNAGNITLGVTKVLTTNNLLAASAGGVAIDDAGLGGGIFITSSAPGAGVVEVRNLNTNSGFILNAAITYSNSIIPDTNNTYDIGNGTVNPRDVYAARDVYTNSIKNAGAGAVLIQHSVGSSISFGAAGGIVLTPLPTKNVNVLDANGNTIIVKADTGWTACTGTESKAGIDSDNVIFTVGALQDLARAVAAIQNTLMNTSGLFVA